jgi:hypothetical protein
MIIEIILILLFYFLAMIGVLYYYNLIQSKESYTKDELKNVGPFFRFFLDRLNALFTIPMFILIFAIASFIGLLLLLVIDSWVINSALVPLILFFVLPYIKSHYEETQVSISDNYTDTVVALIIRYYPVVLLAFCSSVATALLYNWAEYRVIHFLWMAPNLIVVSILTVITMKKVIE